MKTNYIRIPFFCLILTAGLAFAVDIESIESYKVADYLLSLKEPGPPAFIEDMVVFTASSSQRRVGVAFADEGFSEVHWFRQMVINQDPLDIALDPKKTSLYKDSGILFYVHKPPEGASTMEYRLIINGLWTTDPTNPNIRRDVTSGLSWSILALPPREPEINPLKGPPGSLSFVFKGPPGETVSVGGSFNGWDPFMYELKEGPAGNYTINIPLPPGTYQYVFFHRGQRYLDPNNSSRVYSKDGRAASEIIIR
ncbi:MAG: glycogen-binding domain-containing protein [Treponema sp.]|jgi:hypothetical protein|nr:glycogen-binding domain-containing protein [Treponema sp.]